VTVVSRRPGPPLGGLVRAITYQAGEQPRASVEKILPGPGASVWVNLNQDEFRSFSDTGRVMRVPGAMLAGPASRASVIEFEQGRAHVSVTFALGAAACFFASPLELARDRQVPLEDVWGRSGMTLRERLLEAETPLQALYVMESVLLGQMTGLPAPEPLVTAAGAALSAGVRVGEVAEALGVLPRTLRRRFTAQVGLSPKRFARVQRLQRVVRDLDGQAQVDWASVAARHGYADQPHLAEEFRQLASITPAEYLRSRVNGPNHLRFNVPTIVSSVSQTSLVTVRDALHADVCPRPRLRERAPPCPGNSGPIMASSGLPRAPPGSGAPHRPHPPPQSRPGQDRNDTDVPSMPP
jgi:AraC-like DNA-binding protein